MLNSLQDIFCSGEALPFSLQQKVLQTLSLKLHNLYGPTEAAIDVSFYDCKESKHIKSSIVPIGKPIQNSQLYVLDNNLNLCPQGIPGELYIGGVGLARSYLHQPELTKQRFITNPFAKELGLAKTDRLYKTGDLVRWFKDGNLDYIGRTDFQVKIRGFRIELGEIEDRLMKHTSIAQAKVIDFKQANNQYLACYYIIAKNKSTPSAKVLKTHLAKSLPDYMIPTVFIQLNALPLSPSGKLNRKALPQPDTSMMAKAFVAPRNTLEQQLLDIWRDTLKLEKIGIDDNFSHIGGHSLLVVQLIAKINKFFNLSLNVSWVFENITIKKQSTTLAKTKKIPSVYQPIWKFVEKKDSPILFLVHPGGAGAESYREMALLFNELSVYGIESYNFSHLNKPIDQIELLAKEYIRYMQAIQPNGPYFIGGWSLGGTITYEMTQQLVKKGEVVLGLYLLDSFALSPTQWSQITKLFKPNTFTKECRLVGVDDESIKKLILLKQIENESLKSYYLKQQNTVDTILMQALETEFSPDPTINKSLENVYRVTKLENNGWKRLVKHLTVYEFNADHNSILQLKHLTRIAKMIETDIKHKIKK